MNSHNESPIQGIATAQAALISTFPQGPELLSRLSTMNSREFDLVCRFAFNLKPAPGKVK